MVEILEIVFRIFVEVICYTVGKFVAGVIFPNIKSEKIVKIKSHESWKWKGFTYKKGKQKYFYLEGLQVIGMVVVFPAIIIFVLTLYRFLSR